MQRIEEEDWKQTFAQSTEKWGFVQKKKHNRRVKDAEKAGGGLFCKKVNKAHS